MLSSLRPWFKSYKVSMLSLRLRDIMFWCRNGLVNCAQYNKKLCCHLFPDIWLVLWEHQHPTVSPDDCNVFSYLVGLWILCFFSSAVNYIRTLECKKLPEIFRYDHEILFLSLVPRWPCSYALQWECCEPLVSCCLSVLFHESLKSLINRPLLFLL